MLPRLIVSCCIVAAVVASPLPAQRRAAPLPDDEVDSDETRRVLGSSVVTSVSVIMDLGNGSTTLISEPSGHHGENHGDGKNPGSHVNNPLSPEKRPVGSPPALMSPDRYEFYTFDESGELVRRLMTLEQIQSLIAGGDDANRLAALTADIETDTAPTMSENDPQGEVVANVQQVLAEELMASIHKNGSEPFETEVEVEAVVQEVPPPSSPKPVQEDVEFSTPETEESTVSLHGHHDTTVTDESSTYPPSKHNVTSANTTPSTEHVTYTSGGGDGESSVTATAAPNVEHSDSEVENSLAQDHNLPEDESTQASVSSEGDEEGSNDLSADGVGVTEPSVTLSPSSAVTDSGAMVQTNDPTSSSQGDEITDIKIAESSTFAEKDEPISTAAPAVLNESGQVFGVHEGGMAEEPSVENQSSAQEEEEHQLMNKNPPADSLLSHESSPESHETAENPSETTEDISSSGTTTRPELDATSESLPLPHITSTDSDKGALDDFLSSSTVVPEVEEIPSGIIADDFKAPDEADLSDIYYGNTQTTIKNNPSTDVESVSEGSPDTYGLGFDHEVPEVDPVTLDSFNQEGIQEPSDSLLPPLVGEYESKPTQSDVVQTQENGYSEVSEVDDDEADDDDDLLDELAESVSSVLSQVSSLDDDSEESTTKKPTVEPTEAVPNETSVSTESNDDESSIHSHGTGNDKVDTIEHMATTNSPEDGMNPQQTSTTSNNEGQFTHEEGNTGEKYDDDRNESSNPGNEMDSTEDDYLMSTTSTEATSKKDSTTEVPMDASSQATYVPVGFESEDPTAISDDADKLTPNFGGELDELGSSSPDAYPSTETPEQENQNEETENEEMAGIQGEDFVSKTTERTHIIEHDSEKVQDTTTEGHDTSGGFTSTETSAMNADKENISGDDLESPQSHHTANDTPNDDGSKVEHDGSESDDLNAEEESVETPTTVTPMLSEATGTEEADAVEKGATENPAPDRTTTDNAKTDENSASTAGNDTPDEVIPISLAISGANEQHGNKVSTTKKPLQQDPDDDALLEEMHKVAEEESDPLLSAHNLEGAAETTPHQSSLKDDPVEISDNGDSSFVDDKDFADHETSLPATSVGAGGPLPSPTKASDAKPTPDTIPEEEETPSPSPAEEGTLSTKPIAADDIEQSVDSPIQSQKNISNAPTPVHVSATTTDAFKPTTYRPAHQSLSTSTDNDVDTAFSQESPDDFPDPNGLNLYIEKQGQTNAPADELLTPTTEDVSTTTIPTTAATTATSASGSSAGSVVPPLMPAFPPAPAGNVGLEGTSSSLDPDVKRFVDLCNDLALLLYSEVTRAAHSVPMTRGTHGGGLQTRSLVLSPFAISSLLSMVFLGARGPTSEQMNDLLRLDDMITFNPHLVLQNVTESVITSPGVSAAAFVRELYSDKANGKLLEFYKARAKAFYEGHVEEVDFKDVNDVLRRRTNHLVRWQTRGRVPEYLRGSSLKLRSPLAALSANFFEADCQRASSTGTDGEMYFEVPAMGRRRRRLVPIPAVVWRGVFLAGYDPGLDATVLELRHGGGEVSTVLVLPGRHGQSVESDDITGGLSRLEAWLTKGGKESWAALLHSALPRGPLEVQLPRFAHRSVVNVTGALSRMGLHDLFTEGKADLRGLDGGLGGKLHLADMIQMTAFGVCADDGSSKRHLETYPSAQRTGRKAEDAPETQKASEESLEEGVTTIGDARGGRADWSDELAREEENSYVFAAAAAARDLPLALRPRQARIPRPPLPTGSRVVLPRLRFDRPFLYFVRHNPSGFILLMGRFNPRLFP